MTYTEIKKDAFFRETVSAISNQNLSRAELEDELLVIYSAGFSAAVCQAEDVPTLAISPVNDPALALQH